MKQSKHPTMHPRNIYNKRVDFKELAMKFPEFKENTIIDITGKLSLNFKDPVALRALSRTLLKKDFGLDVDFPIHKLVPTVPLRLNYILFIEDILNLINRNENIQGLDIGTGATCIYPLMAAKKNGWHMIGTDINEETVTYAQKNITVNKLDDLIKVVQVKEDTIIREILEKDDHKYDFCMCNPPFFNGICEVSAEKGRPNRPPPRNAFTGTPHEIITEGGEVEFISKLIDESSNFHSRIRVFTSMIGIKRSISPILTKLRNMSDVKSKALTEFFQGHTVRYGIAWTFDDTVDLRTLSRPVRLPQNREVKPYSYSIDPFDGDVERVDANLKQIFDNLQLEYTKANDTDSRKLHSYNIVAYSNTWTHHRQKKREQNKKATESQTNNGNSNQDSVGTLKRKIDDEDGTNSKRLRIDETEMDVDQYQTVYLECAVSLERKDTELCVELLFLDGSGGKCIAHGLLQYFKNHLKFE